LSEIREVEKKERNKYRQYLANYKSILKEGPEEWMGEEVINALR
jgi:HSP90 family molecular chaperone